MKKKKNFIVLAIVLLFILAVPVSAASGTMKLNKTRVSMYVTESTTLKVLDSRGRTKTASWRSSNTRIATVKNGVVTAKKAGTVTITATSNGAKRSCKEIINYFHTTSSAYRVPIYKVNGKKCSKTAFYKVYNKYRNNAKLLF